MSAPAPLYGSPGPATADPAVAPWRRSSVDASAPPETRIAREIREQRCREEELRRLRAAAGPPSPAGHDELLSGYGSEEKDSLTEEGDSSGRGTIRPLSRSQESLSSGHSSGLGSDHTTDTAGRRRVTVRPYEDHEDGEKWSSFARSAETPIEREIRLTREREEERRREQALRAPKPAAGPRPQVVQTSKSAATQNRRSAAAPAEDHRQTALRLATGRVQHEIQEATRRELELRGEGHTITTSEETVDEKVTRPADMADHGRQVRQQWSEPAARPTPAASRPALRPSGRPVPAAPPVVTAAPAQPAFRSAAAAAGSGRGLMAKFISSRGKLRQAGAFAAAAPPPPPPPPAPPMARGLGVPERPPAPVGARRAGPAVEPVRRGQRSGQAPAQRRLQTSWSLDNPAVSSGPHSQTERRAPTAATNRRLLTAEEKIQLELQAMKEREDELRRQRSWALARSQPDLLAALGEAHSQEEDTAPAPGQLTRTMSNPNLIDDQEQLPSGLSTGRRRSGLIDQWESRIQGTRS